LLNAAFKLKQMQLQFRIQIIGDGPLRMSLERQVNELKISNCVELIGQRSDIPAILSDALLLAHTSQNEGCPNVVLEAMACGRPVVATDAGDIPSLVDNGETGYIVSRGSIDSLAERIGALIQNRGLCERMSIAARRKAEKEFGLDRLARETLAAYRSAGWSNENEATASVRETEAIHTSTH
jgi:glycosyltransferase involved in cell wall biosynthesis